MGEITLALTEDEARLVRHALGKALEEGSPTEPGLERMADAIRDRINDALAKLEK
jgi:hypothetical protein